MMTRAPTAIHTSLTSSRCARCPRPAIKGIADAVRGTHGRKKSLLFNGADIVIVSADPRCEYVTAHVRDSAIASESLAAPPQARHRASSEKA